VPVDGGGAAASARTVGVPDIGQQFLELICGLGWQATEEVLEVGEGIDVVMLTGPFHRPDTNQQPRGARRSDDTEAIWKW
jgi:hypothetical protein